ncbi:MAG: FAD binding domain-containing protein [Cyclobacteriaceae bacterium]|nr:FAD binding domain-containing protein [Cyclobacteriaceae bacterium]
MIEFILNDKKAVTNKPTGSLLVDLIRHDQHLKGTKIGCREGDCGACTVLIGSLANGIMQYINVTSCLTPIANIAGKHVVTVEGLNMKDLSPVQHEMVNESGTQCGFCTPGFVVSLSNYCLSENDPSQAKAIAAIDGNICRCTGYKSIERAAANITTLLTAKDKTKPIKWLIKNQFIPSYFKDIPQLISELKIIDKVNFNNKLVGGGTDLYVQQPGQLEEQNIRTINQLSELKFIKFKAGSCIIGGGTTVSDLLHSQYLLELIPNLREHIKLVSSTPIRNISTIAGNFVNASPIGDFTIFFLALNVQITLAADKNKNRTIFLKDFYKGYKNLDKTASEIITEITFKKPGKNTLFNLEKVSKRIHLDIASVNTAIQVKMTDNVIESIHLSAGGIGPIPTYLSNTVNYLQGQELSPLVIKKANAIMQKEVSPISDVRGTKDYKRLLLRQLFYAHFIKLFPNQITLTLLV